MLVLGMMLRLSNSLFIQWSGYKPRPDHVTTTDFQSALSEDRHRRALGGETGPITTRGVDFVDGQALGYFVRIGTPPSLALSKHPNLKRLS